VHAFGWLILGVVVAPSLACAVALVAVVRGSRPPGPEADDYDDAAMPGR
jgi:hypothetical protein